MLAAVVGLVAVRDRRAAAAGHRRRRRGWKTYTVDADNFRFRYPPDWRVEARHQGLRQPDLLVLVPPEQAGLPERRRTVNVNLQAGVGFWIGEDWFGTVRQGRLPGGQAWLRTEGAAVFGGGPEEPATDGPGRYATWTVDWGRPCLTDAPRCATRKRGGQPRRGRPRAVGPLRRDRRGPGEHAGAAAADGPVDR